MVLLFVHYIKFQYFINTFISKNLVTFETIENIVTRTFPCSHKVLHDKGKHGRETRWKSASGHQSAIFGLHKYRKCSMILHVTELNRNKEMLVKSRRDIYGIEIVQDKRSSFEYRTVCGPPHAYILQTIKCVFTCNESARNDKFSDQNQARSVISKFI